MRTHQNRAQAHQVQRNNIQLSEGVEIAADIAAEENQNEFDLEQSQAPQNQQKTQNKPKQQKSAPKKTPQQIQAEKELKIAQQKVERLAKKAGVKLPNAQDVEQNTPYRVFFFNTKKLIFLCETRCFVDQATKFAQRENSVVHSSQKSAATLFRRAFLALCTTEFCLCANFVAWSTKHLGFTFF